MVRIIRMVAAAEAVPRIRLGIIPRDSPTGLRWIRINDRWRICFVWRDDDAWDVEIVDYH